MIYRDGIGEVHVYDSALIGGESPLTRDEAGDELDRHAKAALAEGRTRDYGEALRLAAREHPAVAHAYSGLSFVRGNPAYQQPATPAEQLEKIRARYLAKIPDEGGALGAIRRDVRDAPTPSALVDALVKLESFENPDVSYKNALAKVLGRDPELRALYAA